VNGGEQAVEAVSGGAQRRTATAKTAGRDEDVAVLSGGPRA
jgi:hypothetical protein